MIIPDKKKAVSIIMSKLGDDRPGAPIKPEESMDNEGPSASLAIAQQLMIGLKHESAQEVADALEAFMDELQARDQEQDAQ